MSNNIYDILKKMATLEAPKQALRESKDMSTVKELHNESKKLSETNTGSIAEAVKSVETQLSEKYMGFKKTVAAIKKGGSAENPEAVAASIGRKKYGKEKFQKAAAADKKMGKVAEDDMEEGNKFSGNLMKARAQGLKRADLDGDGDMEKVTKGSSTMREGWEEMQKYLEKKRGPESKGGAGKKSGTRYGGSAQRDDDEETDGEGQPVVKKKGRPKGTGGGAKHSFKKAKD